MTKDLKDLDRKKRREHAKRKKSERYCALKRKYDSLFKTTSQSYFNNVIQNLITSKPGKAYSLLRKLGVRPRDDNSFNIQSHVDLGLSPDQSADHFASVSQEFESVNIQCLPRDVQEIIKREMDLSKLPVLDERDFWGKMCNPRASKSVLPGDLPGKIYKEISPELVMPCP